MTRHNMTDLVKYAARLVLLIIGVVGAIMRAWPQHYKPNDTIPVVDVITLAWVGFAVLGLLLPELKTLTLGVVSVTFKDQDRSDGRNDSA